MDNKWTNKWIKHQTSKYPKYPWILAIFGDKLVIKYRQLAAEKAENTWEIKSEN